VKLIASWYTNLILTKSQLQTHQGWTICCKEEKNILVSCSAPSLSKLKWK